MIALQAWCFDAQKASRISQPVLFVLGGESGPFFEAPMRLFQASVSQTENVVLPGLDHMLQMRDASAVAGPIAEFLGRHPF